MYKSVDPDEMQHYAAFHLGLHYLQKYSFRGSQRQRVFLQHSSCNQLFSIRMNKSVDHYQMAFSKASLSGSTVFSKQDIWALS